MFNNYAYVDKSRVLHVVSDKKAAMENSKNGKVLDVDYACEFGYPIINGKQIVVYGVNECYEDGNRGEGVKLNTERVYPELARLYRELAD